MTDSEKELIENLAEQASQVLADCGFNEEVRDIVQAIATLKQS